MASTNRPAFPGFLRPTTTPVPDEVFDVLMDQLSGAELKVLLYICRRTFGFKKMSDSISLSQMVSGITKKTGDVLDKGTGLHKASVVRALSTLDEMGVIRRSKNRSAEKGDEANTYTLNMLSARPDKPDKDEEQDPVSQNATGGGNKMRQGGVAKCDTQQTVIQETVNKNDVVVEQLKNFGISETIAKRFAANYPEEYITDKLSLAQWLVYQSSPLVRKNPAGWLKTAIEDDFQPPRDYETPSVRKAKSGRQAKAAAAAIEGRKKVEQEFKLAQAEIQKSIRDNHPPEPVGNDGLTTESAWTLTLKRMQGQVTPAMFQTWLKNTMLVSVEGKNANVVVPDQNTADWIERRLYQSLNRTFNNIIGQDVDFRFIPAAISQLTAS